MVIAEALTQRKTLYTKAKALADQIAADAVTEKKNPETTAEQINELVNELEATLELASALTVRINEANNRQAVDWHGNDTSRLLTIMEAIALRDELTLKHQLRVQIATNIDEALGKRRSRYGYGIGRKTKDDVKEVSLIDRDAFRTDNDALAEQRRQLDIEIQKVNWSVDL